MKNILKYLLLILFVGAINLQNVYSQFDRDWWNSLSPSWKKIIQNQELKGRNVDPTDEQLNRILKIKQIDCSNNKDIDGLQPLAKLELLEVIRCNNTPSLKGLEGIETLKNIKEIDCSDNDNINSLIPLSNFNNLEKLSCGNTMVKDLKPLGGLIKLRILDLHFCTISELIFISTLTNLEKLDISRNQSLFILTGIEKLNKLIDLNCSETRINDISPIGTCINLETLDCSKTQIQTLRAVQYLKKMKELNCSETAIKGSSLDYLYSMSSLEMFRCKSNDISQEEKDGFEATFKKKYPNSTILITTRKK